MSTLFINSITDNNIISSAEAQTGFNITGGGQPGATVSLTFDSGQELAGGNTTVVNQNGQWSVPVIAADVKAFSQGMEKVTATQTLGNTPLEVFRTFTVNALFIDSPVIDPITDTAIFNAASTATSLTITGTGQPGATLILGFTSGRTLTGNNTTIVREDGTWSVDIAVADIFIFAQGGEVLTATQIDGESISLPTTQPLLNESGFTRIFGTDGDDELFAPSTGNAQVFGLGGNDILDATPSPEQVMLFGAPGNDTLIGGNNHTLYGGDGDDTLSAAGSIGRNILYGEAGNDLLIVVEGSHNELYGGEDNDRLIISDGGGFNRLYGEAGDDILDASNGTGNNQLFGGEGDDRLIAGAPTDELFGGEGDDHLFAGNGGILTGDGGANTFYLANGSIPSELSIITDFKPGGDRLVIAGLPDLTGVKLIPEGADTILIAVLSDTEVRLALLKGIQPTALVAGRDVFSQTESLLENVNFVILDTLPPTVTIADNTSNIATGDINYTFTFSEAVTGFTAEDITVTNGSKGTFTSVSPTEYTLVVTPNANFEGNLMVDVPGGAAIDFAINPSIPELSVQPVDTKAPTVTITDNISNTASGDINYTFTFSEAVTGFTTEDITVTNGSKGTFTPVSPTQYTLVVTPNANFEGNLTVAVPGGAAIDSAGNPSLAPEVSVQAVDTKAPTVTITSIGAGDSTVSGVAADNTVVGTAEPGSGNVTIRLGNTELGTTAVDENGNFIYSLTEDNLTTIGQGTGKTITASQTDSAGNIGTSTPFTFEVDTVAPEKTGVATDGYISGAEVTRLNGTGGSVTTDTNGRFSFTALGGTGIIRVRGGVDVSTGQPFTGELRAPANAGVITPVTTLVVALLGDNAETATAAEIQAATVQVRDILNLPASIDLLNDDPIEIIRGGGLLAADALQFQRANVQVGSILQAATGTEAGFIGGAQVLAQQTQDGQSIDLTSADFIAEFLNNAQQAGVTLSQAAQDTVNFTQSVSQSNSAIATVENLDAIAQTQATLLTETIGLDEFNPTPVPTLTITSEPAVDTPPTGDPNYQFQVRYTFTFSEPVTGFTADDIKVTNGTKEIFTTVSATEYTLVVGTNVVNRDAPGETGLGVAVGAGAAIGNNSGNPSVPASLPAPVAPVINLAAADDRVNRQEQVDGFNITGTGTPGAEIILRFDSEPNSQRPRKQTTVQPNGTWSIPITADDVQGFDEGEEGIFVYQKLNGNVSPQRSRFINVDTVLPTVSINSIGGADSIVSGVAGDNTVVGTAEPGSGNVTIRLGNTELGTTAVDENGNFIYSLTEDNLTTIGLGTGKTVTASQTDPAGNIGTSAPFTFGVDTAVDQDPGTVTITDPNTGTPVLQQPFDTVFRFSVTDATPSSQELQVVFGDDRIQNILTTLGNASGLPSGIDSILNNLQSGLINVSPADGNVTRFQLRQVGTGTITPLRIGQVTANGFTLSGGGFNIAAEVLGSPDTEIISTQKIEVNGDELEAISLNNLDTSNVTGERITVRVDATLYREAAFDNLVGFYLAERTTGAVVDRLTGQSIGLGDRSAYLDAVRNNAVLTGSGVNNETRDLSSTFEVGSSLDLSDYVLLPFLVANGDLNSVASDFSNLYVASMGNNFDRTDHVQLLGNNVFGFEDLARGGDNDFDDVIIQVRGISLG